MSNKERQSLSRSVQEAFEKRASLRALARDIGNSDPRRVNEIRKEIIRTEWAMQDGIRDYNAR